MKKLLLHLIYFIYLDKVRYIVIVGCIKYSKSILNTTFIIAKFLEGGTSNQNRTKSLIERFLIFKNHYGLLRTLFYHAVILFNAIKNKYVKFK